MAQVKVKEEQELWEPAEVDHSVVEEEPECRGVQSVEDTSSILLCKTEEPEEDEIIAVSVMSKEGEPKSSLLHQTETEENRADTDAAEADLKKLPETEQQFEDCKRYECSECGTRCQNTSKLRIHERIHTGERPFRCTICAKCFKVNSDVNKHMRRSHTENKRYMCSVCAKDFAEKGDLKKHMRTHTGERPFKCTVCEKDFTQHVNLKRHMRMTHTDETEKVFKCSICEAGYVEKYSLTRHMKSHTGKKPFTCLVCAKDFAEKSSLKNHVRIHTGEKPFKCFICAKDFIERSWLERHMRSHTGEKPFVCPVCAKGFTREYTLKRHMKSHTEEGSLTRCTPQNTDEEESLECD